ncbi:LOW QUALITY PROTEIN: ewing's tumor-associated antigen 1-like [Rhynchocyon petersi]
MSRRRKHGYSPGPKVARRTSAAEVCSSAAEPGRRRLRSSRCPGLCGVEERHPQPVLQQKQRPTVASCSKSNPEEKYGTPKRMLKMDILPSSFSSPNDPDGLNGIFWDQNSPMTKHLDKGRKTHINTTDCDEISHVVNRIAPQDEKPITNSMLGVWIGETAIPSTPNVVVSKGKSRAKICYTKLKTHNQAEELMKLAKQFDKNMEEVDVIQEQKYRIHDCTQKISGTKTLNDCNDNIQRQSLCNLVPEINTAVIKKLMKENTKIPLESDLSSSHKSFDQNVEAAFNAIFDDSTQKCSGQLSQDLSDGFLNASNNSFGKKSEEEKIVTSETLITVKQDQTPGSFSSQIHTPIITKSCVTSHAKEPETFNKLIDPFATSDFQEDWENFLRNEPFMMPELPKPKTSHGAVPKGSYTFNRKKK